MQKAEKDFQPNKLSLSSLKNQAAFDLVNKIGAKSHGRNMIMITCPPVGKTKLEEKSSHIYLGLKISKKLGKAVTRNKIRRRIKAMVRSLANSMDPLFWDNKVFVIIPRKGFESIKYLSLQEELTNLIIRNPAKA